MFATITVVADGVLDSEEVVAGGRVEAEIERLAADLAASDADEWAIYRLDHDHEREGECGCYEYATDHRPVRTSAA